MMNAVMSVMLMHYLLLDKEPDLKGNDQIEIDREKAAFPATEEEAISFGRTCQK